MVVPHRASDCLNVDDTQKKMPGILQSKIVIFIAAARPGISQSPNQSPACPPKAWRRRERNAWTGPAISIGASPLHLASSSEKTACAQPRVAHL